MKDLVNNPEHPEGLTETQERLALSLFYSGVFLFDFDKGFRLKHHENYPDAPLSPFYINIRLLQSHLDAKQEAVTALIEQSQGLKFDRIAAVPRAADPLVSPMADRMGVPQITPRTDKKTHGLVVGIDGEYEPGETVLVVDDLITTSASKLETIEILESRDLIVEDVVVVFDREQGGEQELAVKGYNLHAALKIKPTLQFYARIGRLNQEQLDKVMAYLENPLG
ncbi:MAG: Orotidine 5''-phosphate decarboxylase, subfamily 2 [Microgenomates group bacterium GW2011_GWC1_37_8]|nr:MAG: Orotidine 5''-phosphate decarboxylase, subfamily 2 [Microgenomates group bacterium GW2011_GWC1_37_8]